MPHKMPPAGELNCSVQIENLCLSILKEKSTSREKAPSMAELTPHAHSHFELFYCSAGQITIHSSEQCFPLKAYDVAVVPPGIHHQTRVQEENTLWSALVFTCKCSEKECSSGSLFGRLSPFLQDRRIRIYPHLPKHFCDCLQSLMYDSFPNPYLPGILLCELLILLGLQDSKPYHPDNESSSHMRLLTQLDEFIHSRYTENIKFKEVAERLYLSERQLSRIVKKHYGTTFHKLILQKRLLAAQHLLGSTELSLSQISAAVGFSSVAVFQREYLRRYGSLAKAGAKPLSLLSTKAPTASEKQTADSHK